MRRIRPCSHSDELVQSTMNGDRHDLQKLQATALESITQIIKPKLYKHCMYYETVIGLRLQTCLRLFPWKIPLILNTQKLTYMFPPIRSKENFRFSTLIRDN